MGNGSNFAVLVLAAVSLLVLMVGRLASRRDDNPGLLVAVATTTLLLAQWVWRLLGV